MTSDDLRAYLDAHGVDGAPTVPGWYCCAGRNGVGIFLRSDRGVMAGSFVGGDGGGGGDNLRSAGSYFDSDIIRHAPLPDFGAMARELDDLRAKVDSLEGAAREDIGSAFRVGQVWESPTRLTYRVVGIRPSERRSPALISMRQGADGAGRLFVKRGESTFGWRLVTP